MTARKVLIVEDNVALLRGLKDNFQAQGYQVRTANDGREGLDKMLADPPDLVLLDVMLPRVSGYEVCRAARSRRLRTPILMLTAKCQVDDIVLGLELGADDYMTKPFSIRELLARAQALSGRASAYASRPASDGESQRGSAATGGGFEAPAIEPAGARPGPETER